jgi:ribosomal protein S11
MKRVMLVISSAFALGFCSEVFAESFGYPKPYSSHNPMSATYFAKTYGGTDDDWAYSVQQTSDGGYIVAGVTWSFGAGGDIILIKTDANGDIIWAKTYGGTDWDGARFVQQTSDGGYIVVGGTWSFGSGWDEDIILIKTDANGDIIWAKTYGGTDDYYATSVQQTSDGGYIVAGWIESFDVNFEDIFLIKTDANGNIIWAKNYGRIYYVEEARSVQQTSDGGYIVAGDPSLIKTDANGNIIWTKTYEETAAYSVQQTSDGGYIVAGRIHSFGAGSADILIIKTDANGNIIWAKTYGGTDWDGARFVQQTSDGGYIVAGTTWSFGTGGYDIILIKTDANGNIIWAKTYGGTGNEESFSVQQTSDGGYIVAGRTSSFGAGYSDIFIIKTDANGNIGSCSIVRNVSPTVNTISPTVTIPSLSVYSLSPTVYSVSPTVTTPDLTVSSPCPLSISEFCQVASGLITPYKGGIKVSGFGEFEVKVYNVSGGVVKSAKGKNEVKIELSRGVYFVEVVSGGKVIRERVIIR